MTDWLTYAREHIGTSYEEVHEPRKGLGEFLRPVASSPTAQAGPFGNRWVNFHELGATFYSAAKFLDDSGLIELMRAHRDVYALINQIACSSMHNPPDSLGLVGAHHLIPSVQHERLLHAFNQKRINAERFIATNLRHSVELCLKALAAIANEHLGKGRIFLREHNLGELYGDLPSELREEIEAEVPKFADAYIQHAKKIEAARKQLLSNPAQPQTLTGVWVQAQTILNQIIADLNGGGYTVPSSNAVGWDASAGAEALIRSLNDGPSFDEYRYGPKKGPSEYPTDWVINALITGQFFYEHLFPVPLISRSDDGSGPLSEMRGPL